MHVDLEAASHSLTSDAEVAHGARVPVLLHLTDQLEEAIERSHVESGCLAQRRSGPLKTLSWLKSELLGISPGSLRWTSCVVRGEESSSGEPMVLHFHGSLQLVDFCATHILGNSAYTVEYGAAALRRRPPDLVVDYHRLRFFFLRTKRRILLPGRVNQFLPLSPAWPDTIATLPARHTKELKRILRKNDFDVEVRNGRAAMRHFYRTAYVPYAKLRFGKRASIREEKQFLSKHRDSFVLWLQCGSRRIGANVLSWHDHNLKIEDCGLVPEKETMAGAFDVLDYASLLLAQSLKCRELDFGGTRPHVRHGIFRYKAKWATKFRLTHPLAPKIRMRIMNDSAVVRAFLKNNLFLQIVDDSLRIKVLIDDEGPYGGKVDELVKAVGETAVDSLLLVSAGERNQHASHDADRSDVRVRHLSRLDDIALGYLDNG